MEITHAGDSCHQYIKTYASPSLPEPSELNVKKILTANMSWHVIGVYSSYEISVHAYKHLTVALACMRTDIHNWYV